MNTVTPSHSVSICALILAAIGCDQRVPTQARHEADLVAINALQRQADDAVKSGNPEGYLALVTDDAVLMPPDHRALVGKAAIGPWAQRFAQEFTMESYTPTDQEIVVTNGWAFRRSSMTWVLRPKRGGEAVTQTGKFIILYRREPDGSWRIARDIFNLDTPSSTSSNEQPVSQRLPKN
jgi:ketosteroid isomerase-like protein